MMFMSFYDPYPTICMRDCYVPVREKPKYYTSVKPMKHQFKKKVEIKTRNRLRG